VEFDSQLTSWVSILFSGGQSAGNFIFLFLLACALWIVAYFSAWTIFRWQRVWWAVIFCGIVLFLNITYAPVNLTGFLIAFLLVALLLVVRTSLAYYQQEWRLSKIGYSPELVYGFLRAGLIVAVVAIVLAWVAPAALASKPVKEALDRAGEPWRRLQEESTRMFQNLNYRNEPAFVTFGRAMKFGGPVELTDAPVMDVQASSGRYWRVVVFHDYTGDGWINTDLNSILIAENEERLAVPEFDLRRTVTQTITLRQPMGSQGTIAAAGQPLRSALPLNAIVAYAAPDESGSRAGENSKNDAVPVDASILHSRQLLTRGESYQVVSSLTRSDAQSLRESGTEYPEWIAPRYLQLPVDFPERVPALAEEVVAGQESPYDKAIAIESYLREIPYNEQIQGPAAGQDGVDYFLFEAREGYCDYYASAMVTMLRSVGVPARYVRGYSQGSKEEGVYQVLEQDGHAWPEVYFPGFGWVEFEPTAGEPVLVRPQAPPDESGGDNDRDPLRDSRQSDEEIQDPYDADLYGPLEEESSPSLLQRVGWLGWVLLAGLMLGLVVAGVLAIRRHRRIEGLSLAERVYLDLAAWTRRLLGIAPLAHQTPNEYGDAVIKALPGGRQPVERIVDSYVGYRFGGRDADGEQVDRAWSETRRALWWRWLSRKAKNLSTLPRRLAPWASGPFSGSTRR
jgi:transglutaminase-like putative cysteine protease